MVMSAAKTVDAYLKSLPADRRKEISAVRDIVLRNLPKGYVEGMEYGMIYYSIPLSRYPGTYNGHPLCYAGLAAQKNFNTIYLLGVYGDGARAKQFHDAFAKAGKKLDMGKSCVHFKAADDLALNAIGDAIASVSPDEHIAMYEKSRLQTKAGQKKAAAQKATTKQTAARKSAATSTRTASRNAATQATKKR